MDSINKIRPFLWMGVITLGISCGSQTGVNNGNNPDTVGAKKTVMNPAEAIPEMRTIIRPDPVQEYQEKTDNPLNDWYFSVKLYETPVTFHYLVKMKFEEVEGEDTIRLPNFGFMPKPVLKKGDGKYSCIIGFMDAQNQFREYKLVHVENGSQLKLTTLKHYAVTTTEQ